MMESSRQSVAVESPATEVAWRGETDAASTQPAVAAAKTFDAFVHALSRAQGCFSAVVRRGEETWAAVDRIRGFPLFYAVRDNQIHMDSDAYAVRRSAGCQKRDPVAEAEIWHMLYALRDRTLSDGVRQLQAGQAIRFTRNKGALQTERRQYYVYGEEAGAERTEDTATLCEELDEIHLRAFRRLVDSIGDRQVVVPLSGGLDSRLVACMLRRLGCRDVLCFTYGKEHSAEVAVSRSVAHRLGYPWAFVNYQNLNWSAPADVAARRRFYRLGSNLYTVPPMLEDWIAIGDLRRRGLVRDGAVFCPGHTATFRSGRKWINQAVGAKSDRELASIILRQHSPRIHWSAMPGETERAIRDDIRQSLHDLRTSSRTTWHPRTLLERWNWIERQSKRICNMVRAYEYWGHGWRLPLWDAELMGFWERIPEELRAGKRLYCEYLGERSRRDLFGLFDDVTPMRYRRHPLRQGPSVLFRALGASPLGRYFAADKCMERAIAGGYPRYLRMLGRRVVSPEPVTAPWLQLESDGMDAIYNADVD